jgi:Fe2+ transport system protein FeoA
MTFAELVPGAVARVIRVGGEGAFRRRLMELGILPGTQVRLVGFAPLGDPLELLVRGASLSIRRAEAVKVEVIALPASDWGTADAPLRRSSPAGGMAATIPHASNQDRPRRRLRGQP